MNKVKNKLIIFFGIVLFLVQYGCDRDNRVVLGNNYLTSQIDSASNHLLSFSNFEKVDGIEKQKESLLYEMSFKGFIGAVKECYWDGHINSSATASSLAEGLYGSNYGIGRTGLLSMNISISLEELNQKEGGVGKYSLYKKNDGHFVKGYILFEKRDSGWKIIEMDIKHDEEASDSFRAKSSSLATPMIDTTRLAKDYAGTYSYGTREGGSGSILIYPDQDAEILFYLNLSRGAPSYNMGDMYGRVKIVNDNGVFFRKEDYDERGCKLLFQFKKNILILESVEPFNECGFGNGVTGDGRFDKNSSLLPTHFEDNGGTVVYFGKTAPEYYNQFLR